MQEFFSFIKEYIYLEYTLAVIVMTWLVRAAVPKVDKMFNPKITSAFVGIIVGVVGIFYKHIILDAEHVMKFLISFSMASFIYDYTIYFLKKKFSTPTS